MPLRLPRINPISRRHFFQTVPSIYAIGKDLVGGHLSFSDQTGLTSANGTTKLQPSFLSVPPSRSGITWRHVNGRSPNYYLPETTGAGCAFFDYDNDGWMDIYLVNSGRCDFYDSRPPLRNALYKNNRDGTFTDVTEKAGVGAPGWSSSAVWFDYDNDGRLDLFVCQFVDFSKEKNLFCGNAQTGERYYCIPRGYNPAPSRLFHNNGDGTFTDVSKESGISEHLGKAWGVVATDIDNDGRMDLFVANDTMPNFLFANRGHGKFEEIGIEAGVAYDEGGRARSGMGVDSADYDQDGWMDLFVANIDHEKYSLYHNGHDGSFKDASASNGIASATWLMSGWGLKFFDFDNDGNLDLLLANGNPDDTIQEHFKDVFYEEPLLLFRNTGRSFEHAFENVSAVAGPVFERPLAARGLAIGDYDNDGAVDVLVAVNNGAPLLLRNVASAGNHWLGIRLIGKKANRDAVGARVTYQAGDLRRQFFKVGGGSYLASHDPRMVLGIGPRTQIDWIEISWPQPSTLVERFAGLPVDRYITLEEGTGKSMTKP